MKGLNPLAGLIGRSPFKPMQQHMAAVERCAEALLRYFEAHAAGDAAGQAAAEKEVFDLEGEADAIKNSIRAHLPKGLFMPVDRRDLLDMLHAQDSIADTAQDIAGILSLRKMATPGCLQGLLVPFVQRNLEAVRACRRVINELDELVEMGFKGRAVDQVEAMVEAVCRIESETDDMGMELTRVLFQNEAQLRPVDAVFWYRLFDQIGDIADFSQDVGDRLRLLIAR